MVEFYTCPDFQLADQVKWPPHYLRQREYPQPPPPSKNSTNRTSNMVIISCLFSISSRADWGPQLNVREFDGGV
jgi:hypothetical protein